ncbi:MAG TPA: hypothetical protein ENI23_13400 [bacterium]|nr:hypothetical protein [bacterium]
MTYENIQITSRNLTGDRTNAYFYMFDSALQLFQQKDKSDGTTVASFPLSTSITKVYSAQFDGYYYWSLERFWSGTPDESDSTGFLIRRWEIVSGLMILRQGFSFVAAANLDYDASSFIVESYGDSLSTSALVGTRTVVVADGSIFMVGDTIIFGPSTYSGFVDDYETAVIDSISEETLTLSAPLISSYQSGDEVYTPRYLWVFNEHSPYNTMKASLLKLEWDTAQLRGYATSNMFSGVTASTFYNNRIMFVRGHEVTTINPSTMQVYQRMVIDNQDVTRSLPITTFAVWAYNNVVYRLQDRKVYYDGGFEVWKEELWDPLYSYVTSSEVPAVYFVELKAVPNIIHAVATPDVPTTNSEITVTVLDQFRTPLSGRSVTMSSTGGSLVPPSGSTDSDGQFTTTYNGTSFVGEVSITASSV